VNDVRPIAYLAGSFPLRSETFVYREVNALRARGWNVRACALNRPEEIPHELRDLQTGVTYVYQGGWIASAFMEVLSRPVRSIQTIAQARRDGRSSVNRPSTMKVIGQAIAGLSVARRLRGIAHLHCHFAHAPTTVGMYAAKQLGIPFSFTGHANDLFQRRSLIEVKLRRAAFVCCISNWHREFYEQIEPNCGDRYRIVRCGVKVSDFDAKASRIPDERLRVLTVCRLVEKKGVDTLIRALAQLGKKHGIRWHLTVAGNGPDMARLAALANALKCADDIEWLGAVENERVRSLLSAADVFALPCRMDSNGDKDGIPVVLMEAMAAGVPCIGGDLPAIRELIQHERTGLLIGGEDLSTLCDYLARLAHDAELRGKLGNAGRARVAEEFSLDQNIDRLEESLMSSFERAEVGQASDANRSDPKSQVAIRA
jgi:glycosyltransferase involved in cell wall biosynthesis